MFSDWFRVVAVWAVVGSLTVVAATGAGAQGVDTFDDIGDAAVHTRSVEAVSGLGIVEGTECDSGRFCPDEPVDRWVMAVWLVRAVDGKEPPAVSVSRFADVEAGHWWAPYVERLAELGITVGCETRPARFCPDDPVTRAQMATLLTLAFTLEEAPAAGFTDTVGHSRAADIDALAAAGITSGCTADPLRYCPQKAVTRAQTATVLARALGLVPLPEIATPTAPRLAYTQVTGSDSSVIVVDADGSNPRTLANRASGPIWSPDGTRILYRSVPRPESGIWPSEVHLWVVDVDDSSRWQVATGGPFPMWSPDSSRILYRAGGGSGDLWVVDVDGADRRRLGPDAVWSPDGSLVVHSSGDGMFVTDLSAGSRLRIADPGSTPRWWPDDTRIFYAQSEGLWVVEADGSNPRRLGTGLRGASLSPDAIRIAWNGEAGGVWVMNTDGSERGQLTRDGWRPVWAPDGNRLFATYHDSEGWPLGLVAVNADGSGLTEITPGNIFNPVWLPDSRSVAYSGKDVFVVDIDGARRRLINHTTLDTITCLVLSPAGDQLAYLSGNGVYVIDADGTKHREIDRHGACPTWSPG